MAIFVGSFKILSKKNESLFDRIREHSKKQISEYEQHVKSAFAEIDKLSNSAPKPVLSNCKPKTQKPKKIVKKYVVSKKIIPILEDQVIYKINGIVDSCKSPTAEDVTVVKTRTLPKPKIQKKRGVVRNGSGVVENLMHFVRNLMRRTGITLDLCEKRRIQIRFKRVNHELKCATTTHHERGYIRKLDCTLGTNERCLIKKIFRTSDYVNPNQFTNFTPGDSGTICLQQTEHGQDIHVLRGIAHKQIVWADIPCSWELVKNTKHMSANKARDDFWEGLNIGFQQFNVGTTKTHECNRVMEVKPVGVMTGLILHSLFPCHLTTCETCVKENLDKTDEEVKKHVANAQEIAALQQIQDLRKNIFMRSLSHVNMKETYTANACVASEVIKLTAGVQESPMRHMKDLVEYITKGNTVNQADIDKAMSDALEVVRWFRNRTDTIKTSNAKFFRNKLSTKNHLNLALMNDKMMTDDGLYDWKSKAYHCKRFYKDYFDVIEPGVDYITLMERKHIRGSRLLAIKNLIVNSDPQKMIESLRTHSVKRYECDTQCITMESGSYCYPCSCGTGDTGVPIYSRFYMPTKHHLVIGNTGDPKYVNVPGENDRLLIVKNGYCYIHIFLSMLMHLPESDAKDFTKMVRDVIIPSLNKWPRVQDLAAMCAYICAFYPSLAQAELPIILVDHEYKTMHILDSYGSASIHYHVLKANTVDQLMRFASIEIGGELKNYNVGGDPDDEFFDALPNPPTYKPRASGQIRVVIEQYEEQLYKTLIKSSYNKKKYLELLEREPVLACFAILSIKTLIRMHHDGSFESAIMHFVSKNQSMAEVYTTIELLAKKVSLATALDAQIRMVHTASFQLRNQLLHVRSPSSAFSKFKELIDLTVTRAEMDGELTKQGWTTTLQYTQKKKEHYYNAIEADIWAGLSFCAKCSYFAQCARHSASQIVSHRKGERKPLQMELQHCATNCLAMICGMPERLSSICSRKINSIKDQCTRSAFNLITSNIRNALPDFCKLLNVMVVATLMTEMYKTLYGIYADQRKFKLLQAEQHYNNMEARANLYYKMFETEYAEKPTFDEFLEYIDKTDKELYTWLKTTQVVQQAQKDNVTIKMEQMIATFALIMMIFDNERSDALVQMLNKVKSIFSVPGMTVKQQSLDEINEIMIDKATTIDFTLQTPMTHGNQIYKATFGEFWDRQLRNGRTVPHYRTGGEFVEFTRSNCIATCNKIASFPSGTEVLVRGAVGSGKSTGLPYYLSQKGTVLLLEPTRPLTENVFTQLTQQPFSANPTMRMRGKSVFGVSPITVMTTGFAFHLLANNTTMIQSYDYILLDECHVIDSHAMALYSLLRDHQYSGKILKVSATPPGQEVEFTTQYPVTINKETSMTFETFVQHQGTNSNACVVSKGVNILVYVASYNDVDKLSNLLIKAGYQVTKVDGRTMKSGPVSIKTDGTKEKPHFIVATNIIENGVTLDVDCVVDFGQKITPKLASDDRMITYSRTSISYGERIQRMGRVGRIKSGHVLRIGHTEKGLIDIPQIDATAAALLCFAHNLPVMTNNVVESCLANCTLDQIKTSIQFELPYIFMLELVSSSGYMHPEIHKLLKPYKLRDSEITLSKSAIPYGISSRWLTAQQYELLSGQNMTLHPSTRIPYLTNGVPTQLYEDIYRVCIENSKDAHPVKITMASCQEVAYTLRTDLCALPRTLCIIEELIIEERRKEAMFRAVNETPISCSMFSIENLGNKLKQRYMVNHSKENIRRLEDARNQLIEYAKISTDNITPELLAEYHGVTLVTQQSKDDIITALNLKGKYKFRTIMQDCTLAVATLFGGASLLYIWFTESSKIPVRYQGKASRNKLKYRDARFNKSLISAFGSDDAITENFGAAYRAKGKQQGHKKGMGVKTRKFTTFYGFDPSEYDIIRFLDPVTGITYDRSVYGADAKELEEDISADRLELISMEAIEPTAFRRKAIIEAYFMNSRQGKALKVDLTRHEPLAVSDRTGNIMGYPEREDEFRQTGQAQVISIAKVPQEMQLTMVQTEAKSVARGLRDYNPIGEVVCFLTVTHDIGKNSLYGIGYGSFIITNAHLFKHHGKLKITTQHGVFEYNDTRKLEIQQVPERDMVVVKLPKDYPPLPKRLHFRQPEAREKIILVGAQYQVNRVITTISGEGVTYRRDKTHFWTHWITTKDGQCGLPIVSTRSQHILGLHSLGSEESKENFFTAFPDQFAETYLAQDTPSSVSPWNYTHDSILWGTLYLPEFVPQRPFSINKELSTLFQTVACQSLDEVEETWLTRNIHGSLQHVGNLPGTLITKHVVHGRCPLFSLYLQECESARNFFTPLMGKYGKSKLNKEAFVKDFTKYTKPITIGEVDTNIFDQAVRNTISILEEAGIEPCVYVTDHNEIFDSLNMKSAVGAMYGGKKEQYFENFSADDLEEHLIASCERVYNGKMGIWNGSLKAEIRSIEKVEANKTRVFTAAPIDTLLAGKVCVDDFNNQFYTAHLKGPWTVGITKFYKGWDQFMSKLPKDWVYCDADGSQFDSSLTPFLINAILNIRLHFLERWNIGDKMLKNYYTEIIYTPIATPDGSIIKKSKGNNSGQPSTVVDNTLMVILTMQYALLKLGIEYTKQKECVIYFANGDDLVIAINPNHVHILDGLASCFLELGLNYDFTNKCTKLEDLSYMSHQALERDGIYIPKLEKERIVAILEWDRSNCPEDRMNAIVASMIEAWGYDDLLHHIRSFYCWMLTQYPYSEFAVSGKFPNLAETALRKLYMDEDPTDDELLQYAVEIGKDSEMPIYTRVRQQSDAGSSKAITTTKDKDVDAGTKGMFTVPRPKNKINRMNLPTIKGKVAINIEHLMQYMPRQVDLYNTRSTQEQFSYWYENVMKDLEIKPEEMEIVLNGFMVWCIENSTSPNITGEWTMMDGDEQVTYPIAPFVKHAKPTLRQIMHHFSNAAEAYIILRNSKERYMPRYGQIRNLQDDQFASIAFDFYELTSATPKRAREIYHQMKAAALSGTTNRTFGLDGNVGTSETDTERHVASDVNRNTHSFAGTRMI